MTRTPAAGRVLERRRACVARARRLPRWWRHSGGTAPALRHVADARPTSSRTALRRASSSSTTFRRCAQRRTASLITSRMPTQPGRLDAVVRSEICWCTSLCTSPSTMPSSNSSSTRARGGRTRRGGPTTGGSEVASTAGPKIATRCSVSGRQRRPRSRSLRDRESRSSSTPPAGRPSHSRTPGGCASRDDCVRGKRRWWGGVRRPPIEPSWIERAGPFRDLGGDGVPVASNRSFY